MTTVREIESFLYGWAPRELAESWDNVGLLVGDPEAAVERVLVLALLALAGAFALAHRR